MWLNSRSHLYHSVNFRHSAAPTNYNDETNAADWSKERYQNLIRLKQEALKEAAQSWADYAWFLDADVLVSNPDTLRDLINANKPIIAPLLKSFGRYSNFWGAVTEDKYYARSDDYIDLIDRKKTGVFSVPLVHSCVLVDMRRRAAQSLSFDPATLGEKMPYDDIIALAVSANKTGSQMFVTNEKQYGVVPLVADVERSAAEEEDMLLYLRLLATEVMEEPLTVSTVFDYSDEKKASDVDGL